GASYSTYASQVLTGAGHPLTGITAVSVGANGACALAQTGSLYCWGSNASGELGIGTTDYNDHVYATAVTGLSNAVQVRANYSTRCARKADNTVACWGDDTYGTVGNGKDSATFVYSV